MYFICNFSVCLKLLQIKKFLKKLKWKKREKIGLCAPMLKTPLRPSRGPATTQAVSDGCSPACHSSLTWATLLSHFASVRCGLLFTLLLLVPWGQGQLSVTLTVLSLAFTWHIAGAQIESADK